MQVSANALSGGAILPRAQLSQRQSDKLVGQKNEVRSARWLHNWKRLMCSSSYVLNVIRMAAIIVVVVIGA